MSLTAFFALLGSLLVLAFVANRLALRTGVPDIIVLMATGLLLGPVFHWIDPSRFEGITRGFGALALILILFEAGLELDLRDTLRHFPGGLLLSILSYALAMAGMAYFSMVSINAVRLHALLIGAVVGCISSSVVLPVVQQLPLRTALKVTLVVEASVSDALGVLAVGMLLDFYPGAAQGSGGWFARWLVPAMQGQTSHGSLLGSAAAGFFLKLLISLLLAVGAGILWTRLRPILSEQRFWQVLTFGAVLLVYSGAHFAGGSDLFAVIAFGTTLANFGRAKTGQSPSELIAEFTARSLHHEMLTFHSELAFLVRTFFFVLLGVIVQFDGLRDNALFAVGALGVLFLTRWLAVQISRVAWRGIQRFERELMVWMIPRGLITAVLALEVYQAHPAEFPHLTSLAFALILLTNLILLVGSVRAKRLASAVAPDTPPLGAPPSN